MTRRAFHSFSVLALVSAVVVSITAGPTSSVAAAPVRAAVVAAVQPTAAGAVVSVAPARIADSRVNLQITGPVRASGTVAVKVTGNGGVPANNVAAAVLTVTVVAPQTAGYVTVWPSGIARTRTSNLNFRAGQSIPNTVIVPVGAGGKVQLFNGSGGSVQLLVDITAYTLAGTPTVAGAVVPVAPARIADSRADLQITGPVRASGTVAVKVTGHGGVPAGTVAAAVLNVTVVAPQKAGYVTVWPSGIARTSTSNLSFQAGQNIPNTVIVPVGADGKIQLFNGSGGTVQLLVDVTGYMLAGTPTAAGAVVSVAPARIADSRTNLQMLGAVRASGTATMKVTGNGQVPRSGVAAAVLTVTVVAPQKAGYVTVWPSGIGRTATSNLNFQAGQNISSTVLVPVGADGKIQLFNGAAGSVQLLVDITGYTLVGTSAAAPTVTAIASASGGTSGGTVVTVTGTKLTGASGVAFDGTRGTALTVVSATQLKVTSPGHPAGLVDVQVTTAGGTSAVGDADRFTYTPAGTTLNPSLTIADGRGAPAPSFAVLSNVNGSAFLYSDGTVRFGPNFERTSTNRGVRQTIIGTKVVAFEDYGRSAILFSDLDGSNQQRFPKPQDGQIIAPAPDGWLEAVVAGDGSSVSLRRATIGPGDAITRTTIGVMTSAPAGLIITGVDVYSSKNTDQLVAFTLATRYSNGHTSTAVKRLKYATNELTTLANDAEGTTLLSWSVSAVNNGAVTLSGYSGASNAINATRRIAADGTAVTWTYPYTTYTVKDNGDTAVWTQYTATYQIGKSFRGNADGTVTEIASPWWVTRQIVSVGTDSYYLDPTRGTIKTTAAGSPETVIFGLSPALLGVSAVDVTAGKIAWIDNSKTGTPHAAWRRDLNQTGSTKTLVLDRATGLSIAQAAGSTFVLQDNSARSGFADLVKVSAGGSSSIMAPSQTLSGRIHLSATSTTLLANSFRGRLGLSSMFDVTTSAATALTPPATSGFSQYGLSDHYLVRTDTMYPAAAGGPVKTTIMAKSDASAGDTVIGSIPSGVTGQGAIAGDYAVVSSNTRVYWVDLTNPGTGLQSLPFAGGSVIGAHGSRFAVSDVNGLISVYTVGQRSPDFSVQSSSQTDHVAFDLDDGWVAWTKDGPDGDVLVGTRIPGTTG